MSCNCEFCFPFNKAFGSKFEQAYIVANRIIEEIGDEEGEIALMALLITYRSISHESPELFQTFALTALEHTRESLMHEFEPHKDNNLIKTLNIKGSKQ